MVLLQLIRLNNQRHLALRLQSEYDVLLEYKQLNGNVWQHTVKISARTQEKPLLSSNIPSQLYTCFVYSYYPELKYRTDSFPINQKMTANESDENNGFDKRIFKC